MAESVQPDPLGELPRREVMQTPDEVAAMLRLKGVGMGDQTDRESTGLQPHAGSPLCGAGRVAAVSRSRSAARLGAPYRNLLATSHAREINCFKKL